MKKICFTLFFIMIVITGCSKKKVDFKETFYLAEQQYNDIKNFELHMTGSYNQNDQKIDFQSNLNVDLNDKMISGSIRIKNIEIPIYINYSFNDKITLYYKIDDTWVYNDMYYSELLGEYINELNISNVIRNIEFKLNENKDYYTYKTELDYEKVKSIFEVLLKDDECFVCNYIRYFNSNIGINLNFDKGDSLINHISFKLDKVYDDKTVKISDFEVKIDINHYNKIDKINISDDIIKKSINSTEYELMNKTDLNLKEFYEMKYDNVLLCRANDNNVHKQLSIYMGFSGDIITRTFVSLSYEYFDEEMAKNVLGQFDYDGKGYSTSLLRSGSKILLSMMNYEFVDNMSYDLAKMVMEKKNFVCL